MKAPAVRSISPSTSLSPSCSPARLPSQTGLSRLGELPPLFCHPEPHNPYLPATPHGPRPETRLLEASAARNPAPSATGSPSLEKPTSCCRRRVTAPPPRPACDAATCRAWQAPELPVLPRPAPGQDGLGRPQGGGAGRRPLATRDDLPRSPPTPPAEPPPGSQESCGVSTAPQPLTRAGTVLRRRNRAAREGRGRWPEREEGERSAPSTASASSTRQGGERGEPGAQQPAPRTRRRARPPPPQPRGRPLHLVLAHAAQLSQSPQRSVLCAAPAHRPSCRGLPPPPPARAPAPLPVPRANGSAPLLHKREGAGLRGDGGPSETGTAGDVALCPLRTAPLLLRAPSGRLQPALGAA